MTLINLNVPSLHSPKETIRNLLHRQLSLIHSSVHILGLFKNKDFTNVVTTTSAHLINLIENRPSVEDIVATIILLKDALNVVSKELHHINDYASQKTIYIKDVHNVYSIFILEMNSLITNIELNLRNFKLSHRSLDNILIDPYIKPIYIQNSTKSNDDSPPLCCWNRKKKNIINPK